MRVCSQSDKNGKPLYYKVINNKKTRISRDEAQTHRIVPCDKLIISRNKSTKSTKMTTKQPTEKQQRQLAYRFDLISMPYPNTYKEALKEWDSDVEPYLQNIVDQVVSNTERMKSLVKDTFLKYDLVSDIVNKMAPESALDDASYYQSLVFGKMLQKSKGFDNDITLYAEVNDYLRIGGLGVRNRRKFEQLKIGEKYDDNSYLNVSLNSIPYEDLPAYVRINYPAGKPFISYVEYSDDRVLYETIIIPPYHYRLLNISSNGDKIVYEVEALYPLEPMLRIIQEKFLSLGEVHDFSLIGDGEVAQLYKTQFLKKSKKEVLEELRSMENNWDDMRDEYEPSYLYNEYDEDEE